MEVDVSRFPEKYKGGLYFCILAHNAREIIGQAEDRTSFEIGLAHYPEEECHFRYVFDGVSSEFANYMSSELGKVKRSFHEWLTGGRTLLSKKKETLNRLIAQIQFEEDFPEAIAQVSTD
jgi:hypothetical protein